jgi:hypothetical protein
MPASPLLALLLSASAPGLSATVLEAGRYSLVVEVVGQRSVPFLGDVEMRTRTTTLVDLVHDGDELVATEQVCAITSQGLAPFGVLFDGAAAPASMASLGRPTWRIPAKSDGAKSDRVRIDLGARAFGYTGGALPTRADDPRVTDPDGNGRRGALLHMDVSGVGRLNIDVVGLWATTLDGEVIAPGLARGLVKVRSEERILAGLPIPAQLGPIRIDERRSTFTLTRLPSDTAGCAIALAGR